MNVDEAPEGYWFRLLVREWAHFCIFLYIGYVTEIKILVVLTAYLWSKLKFQYYWELLAEMSNLWQIMGKQFSLYTSCICYGGSYLLSYLTNLRLGLISLFRWTFRTKEASPNFSVIPSMKGAAPNI